MLNLNPALMRYRGFYKRKGSGTEVPLPVGAPDDFSVFGGANTKNASARNPKHAFQIPSYGFTRGHTR